MIIQAKAKWACVNKPNTKFTPQWSISAVVSDEVAKKLTQLGLRPKYDKDGDLVVKFKRYVQDSAGEPNLPPVVVDSKKKPFPGLIGNGSTVNIQFSTYNSKVHNMVVATLEGVQVLNLVEFTKDEFTEVDGAFVAGEATSTVTTTSSEVTKPVAASELPFDDEIPIL